MFFNVTREKSGRPGRFCDVIITYLPPFYRPHGRNGGMITSQNRPGLPDFSRVTLKNMGRPGDEATLQACDSTSIASYCQ